MMNVKRIKYFRNMKQPKMLIVLLLISSMLFTAGCIYSAEPEYQTGELNFTVMPEKTQVQEREVFDIYSNAG
ncbi:MAG: hypothetical protein RBT65_02830 [Methanolobus sp.]|jgi:hypothetical protein|nr:hypothetical protein [Methanolobus sp.]